MKTGDTMLEMKSRSVERNEAGERQKGITAHAAHSVFKQILSLVLASIVFLSLLTATGKAAHAYGNLPESIRIGLLSADPKAGGQAVGSISAYSSSGIQSGFVDRSGQYVGIYDFKFLSTASRLKIEKHSFNKKYAVRLDSSSEGLTNALWLAASLRDKGYSVVTLAYMNGWVLLVGEFNDRKEAVALAEGKLKADFPKNTCETQELSGRYLRLSVDGTPIFIYDTAFGNMRIYPAKTDGSSQLLMDGESYRGSIELIRDAKSDMTVVNVLSMEEYLYRVVPREIEASSEMEALKAQAVAARTYAANSIKKHGEYGFDLCTTQDCQVHGKASWEHERTNLAVNETKGKVLTWQGIPALVFYFSSSGGSTEDVKNVWGSDYPYLISVKDEYESGNSTNYNWEAVYTAKQIQEQLEQKGVDIGTVTGVSVTKISESGRATEVTITGSKGTKVYKNEACRYFISGLYSQLYTITGTNSYQTVGASGNSGTVKLDGAQAVSGSESVKKVAGSGIAVSASGNKPFETKGEAFRFVGKGWGHGVGMSQEGAKGMALAGFNYEEILCHYFPGCVVN